MHATQTPPPAPPVILCTLCRYHDCRAVPASHYYHGAHGRCYVCPQHQQQVGRLAASFPRDFPEPAPLAGAPPLPLFIVACSQRKDDRLKGQDLPAREAYAGTAFRLCRDQLEAAGAAWCILSGEYGIIWPDAVISDYNQKMEPVTADTVWDDCFSELTESQFIDLMAAEHVTVLGSSLYAEAARHLLQREVAAPVAGLPIGKMLAALKAGHWMTPHPRLASAAV